MEFKAFIQDQMAKAEKVVSFYESIEDEDNKDIIMPQNNRYLSKDGGKMIFNRNLPKIDYFKYKVVNDYATTLTLCEKYVAQDSTVECAEDNTPRIRFYRLNKGAGIDMTFKEVVQEICNASDADRKLLIKDAEVLYPFLGNAIKTLGFERIDSLHYNQKLIKLELLRISDASKEEKIVSKLKYKVGQSYSKKAIKRKLANAYDALGYNHMVAKATDLDKYYYVKRSNKRVGEKRIEGYIVLAAKC